RDEDVGREARRGAEACQRRRGVACGRAGHYPDADLKSASDPHRRRSVLKGACGIAAVVLDIQVRETQVLSEAAGEIKRCPAHLQVLNGFPPGKRQEIKIAPLGAVRTLTKPLAGQPSRER